MATPGIRRRHRKGCPDQGKPSTRCDCPYRPEVYDPIANKKIRATFQSEREARVWKSETERQVRRGELSADPGPTLRELAKTLFVRMEAGTAEKRGGGAYKPSVVRSYRQLFNCRIDPWLGAVEIGTLKRWHVRKLVDRLLAEELDASTIRNTIVALRAIVNDALDRELIAANPITGVRLPSVRGRRDRVATPDEARALLAALEPIDRATWALALYGGLRLGELRALRWSDLELDTRVLHVRRSYCNISRQIVAPKSHAGERIVPILAELRAMLLEHRLLTQRLGSELVVVNARGQRPEHKTILRRARKAWASVTPEPLTPILPHECRHTFASLAIAAGVDAKELSDAMGHESIAFTQDRYGHLFPESRTNIAAKLDRYLAGGE